MSEMIARLEATIAARAAAPEAGSYTSALLAAGPARIAKKLGEEAVETVIAGLSDDKAALAGEAADLVYHLLVLLRAKGVAFAEVEAILGQRHGTSGLAEKAARAPDPTASR
jgi:phosphoribosyl-ATP pyrophosphohydrolase